MGGDRRGGRGEADRPGAGGAGPADCRPVPRASGRVAAHVFAGDDRPVAAGVARGRAGSWTTRWTPARWRRGWRPGSRPARCCGWVSCASTPTPTAARRCWAAWPTCSKVRATWSSPPCGPSSGPPTPPRRAPGPAPADPAGMAGRLLERLPELTGSDPARIDPARGGVIDVPDRVHHRRPGSRGPHRRPAAGGRGRGGHRRRAGRAGHPVPGRGPRPAAPLCRARR